MHTTRIRRRIAAAVVAALAVTLLLPAAGTAVNTNLQARMNGDKEVPGPGDPNGRGLAEVRVNPARSKLCFDISFRKIQAPFAGHVHRGKRDESGPVKVTLFEDAAGATSPVEGCERGLRKKLLRKIKRNPSRFYVNLHNDQYPDGAIRGQLRQ